MESSQTTNNSKYERIKSYLNEMTKNIKPEFIERFAYNYTNRGQWVSSEWIYEWFCLVGKTTRYNDFCNRYILKLNPQYYQLTVTQNASIGEKGRFNGQDKQIYKVSQNGIKLIMMKADQNTQEYFIQLEELMFDYIDKKEDELQLTIKQKEEENKQLLNYIEENKEEYVIYEHRIIDDNRRYRGITNNIEIRNNSHRRKSCNPHLRGAFEQGKQVETKIVKRFRSLSRNECKQVERDSILEIPENERLNIKIPRVLVPIKQDLDNDLTTIAENYDQLTYQELNDIKWEQKYQQCVDYKQQYGKLPSDYRQSKEIKQLALWITCMKRALANKNRYRMTEYRKLKINELLKDYLTVEQQWEENYQKCLQFKEQNNAFPKKGSRRREEQVLAIWLLDSKRFLSQGKYNEERVNKMNILLDGYQSKDQKWDNQYEQCLKLKQEQNRFPGVNERKLYAWLADQKTFLKHNDPRLTDERKDKLKILLESVEIKTLEQRWNEQYDLCIQLMTNNQSLIQSQKNWICVQKKALEGVGYINEARKEKIPRLVELYQTFKQK